GPHHAAGRLRAEAAPAPAAGSYPAPAFHGALPSLRVAVLSRETRQARIDKRPEEPQDRDVRRAGPFPPQRTELAGDSRRLRERAENADASDQRSAFDSQGRAD